MAAVDSSPKPVAEAHIGPGVVNRICRLRGRQKHLQQEFRAALRAVGYDSMRSEVKGFPSD